jgi:hypothetical protein
VVAAVALGCASLGVAGHAHAAVDPGRFPAAGLVYAGGEWAPASTASVHPGVVTVTIGSWCTANFLFTDGAHVYLGQAAHCSAGVAGASNGCTTPSLPLGTPVHLQGSDVTGTMAYNSWLAMQELGEQNVDACAHNDLALIQLPSSAIGLANPSVPVFGGPVDINTIGTNPGDQVLSYGNSPLRQGIGVLATKAGTSLGDGGDGWTHEIYTVTPGIPGDSGSAVLDSAGQALGDLTTLELAPVPGANHASDLAHELAWARAHLARFRDLRLIAGTEPFFALR